MSDANAFRLFYPYEPSTDAWVTDLWVYSGAPVQVTSNDAPPVNSLPFEPPQVPAGHCVYFDGLGWWAGPDLRKFTLPQRKKIANAVLDAKFRRNMDSLSDGYTEQEMFTWASQEAEARAYKRGEDATYLLQALAAANNYTIAYLCDRIIYKADLYRKACTDVLAAYQKVKNQVEQAIAPSLLPSISSQDFRQYVNHALGS